VPGRNIAEAVDKYLHSLQQSASCLTRAVLRPSGYEPDVVLVLTFSDPSIEVITKTERVLYFSFAQNFSISRFHRVSTEAYSYVLEDEHHNEIVAYHWNPRGEFTEPHLHVGFAADQGLAMRKVHFPTGRVAFEEFCLLLINEFQVEPERSDAIDTLKTNLRHFRMHKSW